MLIKRIVSILLCIITIFTITACDNSKDAYIYFELPNKPATLDPQTASDDSELLIIKNIFEGLLRKNEDGKIVCAAAKSYKKENLTYTFTLSDNAKWSDSTKITSDDFIFAFRRALNPETNSPFVARLFSIVGAKEYNSGKGSFENVGIKATNDKTLVITLKEDDEYFEETLTSSIAMPCNEKFFYSTAGKYGIFADAILSCGSYKITRWRKDPFGIRLYKNDKYSGFADAKNAAVFLTCEPDKSTLEKLQKNSIDMAFIDCTLTDEAKSQGFKTKAYQNICWFLSFGNEFSQNMRKALSMLVGAEVFSKDLPVGYQTATSIYPDALSIESNATGVSFYNPTASKELFISELNRYEDKKFPTDVKFLFYDNGQIKNVVTSIVGHWQSNLSAFVNIEHVTDSNFLTTELLEHTYPISLFPLKADSACVSEYFDKFGVAYNEVDTTTLQAEILKSNNLMPIMFQNTVIAYSPALETVVTEFGNGYIDFAFIVKSE